MILSIFCYFLLVQLENLNITDDNNGLLLFFRHLISNDLECVVIDFVVKRAINIGA